MTVATRSAAGACEYVPHDCRSGAAVVIHRRALGQLVDPGSYLVTLLDMSTEQVMVSLPEDVRRASRRIPDGCGLSLSAVVAEAVTRWLQARLVDAWLAERQAEHGAFDENELRTLAAEVGVPRIPVQIFAAR
jgi:hypothetical protein